MHVSVLGNPDDSVVVTVRGDLDHDGAAVLATTLAKVLQRPVPRVVVDLSGVASGDSAGLAPIVAGDDRARAAGGWVRLAAPGEWLTGLLGPLGPPPRPGVYPSVAEALAGLHGG